MNKQRGFALVEGLIIVGVVAALAGGGYAVWHKHNHRTSGGTTNAKLDYNSPAVTAPTAPQVTNSSDLNTALETLNQTQVNASNTDSTQLGSQASGF